MGASDGAHPGRRQPLIADLGFVSDCHSAALIRQGSVDRWCVPGSMHPRCSVASSILTPATGRSTRRELAVERHYAESLLVLRSVFETADGEVTLTYSHGMRQRLHLGRSRTVFITTHDMAEAEAVCDRVTFIDRGRCWPPSPGGVVGAALPLRKGRVRGRVARRARRTRHLAGCVPSCNVDATTRIEFETQAAVADVMRRLVDAGVTSLRVMPPEISMAMSSTPTAGTGP